MLFPIRRLSGISIRSETESSSDLSSSKTPGNAEISKKSIVGTSIILTPGSPPI